MRRLLKINKFIKVFLFMIFYLVLRPEPAHAAAVDLVLQNVTSPATSLLLDEEITYTVSLSNTNAGTTATGNTINLPASIRALRVTCTTTGTAACGTYSVSGNTAVNTTSTILGNATAGTNSLNLTVVGRVRSSGTIVNSISVTKGTVDTEANLTNNTQAYMSVSVTTQTPFASCPGNGFYIRGQTGSTILSSLDVATGAKSTIGSPPAFLYNAMGFNPNDGFLYAIKGASDMSILRIDSSHNIANLGKIDFNGFIASTSASAAEFNTNNEFFMIPNSGTEGNILYKINLDRTNSNFGKVTSINTLTYPSGFTSTGTNIGDLSLNPVDIANASTQYIYGTETGGGNIFRIDPSVSGGNVVLIPPAIAGQGLPAVSFGGNFFSKSGTLYVVSNVTGQFYGVTFNAARDKYIIKDIGAIDGDAPFSATDGARCANAPDPLDIQIVKTTTTPTVNVGDSTSYTLEITNNGPQPIFGVTVNDNVPASISTVNWTCAASGSISDCGTATSGTGNNISVTTGFLGAGAANKLTFTITGTSATKGVNNNTATITIPTGYDDSNPANNSSSSSITITANSNISGRVFEDINYGGGAGRDLATSVGAVRAGARVELYNSSGAFVAFDTTNALGVYTFANQVPANYTVRVVNSSVKSPTRSAIGTELGVQTFRTNVSTGAVVPVTDFVGGQNPTLVDPANGGIGTIMNTTTGVFTTGLTGTAQSITNVNLIGTADITTADFGFNFDTIVNKNATGQGSLDQFIVNSNVLDNALLNQVGQTAGQEVSIFMIPNGVANAGQNTSYANQLNSYGAAQIDLLTTPLTQVTGANTSIDGRTQTKNVRTSGGGETNSGQSGSGGFVGVSQTYLSKFDNPEVEVLSSNITGLSTSSTATGFVVRNLAFPTTRFIVNGNSSLIQDNLVSMNANGSEISPPHSLNYCIEIGTGTANMIARHNYVKCNNSGIRRDGNGSNMTIEYNEVDRPSVGHTATYEAILIIGGGNDDLIQYNLVKNQRGAGSELGYNPGAVVNNLVVKENTYTGNGRNLDGTPSPEPLGIIVRTINDGSIVDITKNIIANSGGTGILIQDTRRVQMSQNSIFRNGPQGSQYGSTANLGIDLRTGNNVDPNAMNDNIDGVTPNDGTISGLQANNGTDYPIITSATVKGTTVKIQGYVGIAPGDTDFANAILEFFVAEDDGNNNGNVFSGDALNVAHGEGKVYIDSCTTGSSGSFNCTFNNVQGLVPGMLLTSTATNQNNDTSEFSNLLIVTEEPFLFYPNNADSALPGGTVYYPHEIVSSEAGNIQLTSTTDKGWTYQVFRDVNGNNLLDGPDTLYAGGANPSLGDVYNLNASHSIKLIVKGFVPEGVAINTVDKLNITATLTPTAIGVSPKSLDVQDITTVSSNQGGSLKLIKSVLPTGNQPPNSNLTYTINFTNTGVATLKDIDIEDVVPAETTFVSASFNVGTTGTIVSPTVGQGGKITWTVTGNLASGATGSVNFVVKIKP